MQRTLPALLTSVLLISGCATKSPVAVSCPAPPPVPQILAEPPSTGPTLSERYEILLKELRTSLEKATRQGQD